MKFMFLPVVFLLILFEHKVLSDCPESGCECGEHCVDNNELWCKNNSDSACSCKPGCLLYNFLIYEDTPRYVYCVNSFCMHAGRNIVATPPLLGCKPYSLKEGRDYPAKNYNPNCIDVNNDDNTDTEA